MRPDFLIRHCNRTGNTRDPEAKHGATTVPSFYVKKATETIWVNKQSEKSSAPVVKVVCDASGTATLRAMLTDVKLPEIFSKFVSNNNEKQVKWAFLNDHIDELNTKHYLIIQGPGITVSKNILEEEGTDSTQKTGTLRNLFKAQGMIPHFQEGQGGKSVFAQVSSDKLMAVQVYLTTNFVDEKANDWKIQEKTIKRTNMIKGVVDTKVPTVLNTTSGPRPVPWARNASTTWSQASTTRAGSDRETVATLKIDLDNMSHKCDKLEKEKEDLTKEVEELKSLKTEFETFKNEQKEKDNNALTEQQANMSQLLAQMESFRTQIETLTQDNSRLQETTQKLGFFTGIMGRAFQPPAFDQSLSTTLPIEDDLLEVPNNWLTTKGGSRYPRTSANGTPPRGIPNLNTNRYTGLSDHGDDEDVDFETSVIVRDADTSIVDAHSDTLNTTLTSHVEVNLSTDMPVDGVNE
jgi:predicted transcriptional regulator